MPARDNQFVADRLREAADLLEEQQANPFRVRAYREAARTISGLPDDLQTILDREGTKGLTALPGIGRSIAASIAEMLGTARWIQLERLRGASEPEQLFRAIPGIGKAMARRIHDYLHVDTLPALEVAAHDGRLAAVPGIGLRRAAMIRAALAEMLGRPRPEPATGPHEEPSVALLLEVDEEYRRRAESEELPTIAPKRFNPAGEAWLPILHTQRDGWQFTVLFSNTARAHELGRTRDWVMIYFHHDDEPERQRTVVTERRGALAGLRVVRGREASCLHHYAAGARTHS